MRLWVLWKPACSTGLAGVADTTGSVPVIKHPAVDYTLNLSEAATLSP